MLGMFLFRSAYRRDFPHRVLSESEVTEAIKQDEKQRKQCEQTVDKSTHRGKSDYRMSGTEYIYRVCIQSMYTEYVYRVCIQS